MHLACENDMFINLTNIIGCLICSSVNFYLKYIFLPYLMA